jgi:hypothetical protein
MAIEGRRNLRWSDFLGSLGLGPSQSDFRGAEFDRAWVALWKRRIARLTGAIAADGTPVPVQINTANGQDRVRERILLKLAALSGPEIDGRAE